MPPQGSREQYAQGRITSDLPAPLEIQAVRDLVHARGREMQAKNLNAQVAAQVGIGLVGTSCANRMMACLTPACCSHLQVDAPLPALHLLQGLALSSLLFTCPKPLACVESRL